jgi:hypothetical protein
MTIYSGSGILPIMIINKKPYLITFLIYKNTISDGGGKIENNSVKKTAIRELYEESAGLIKLKSNDLVNSVNYNISKYNNNKYYKSYILIIDNIDTKYYNKNLIKFEKYKKNPYTETKEIILLDMDYIINHNNKLFMKSIDNKVYILHNRLESIIKKIINQYTTLINFYNYLSNKLKIIKLNKKKYNIKTYQYYTNKNIKINNIISFIS